MQIPRYAFLLQEDAPITKRAVTPLYLTVHQMFSQQTYAFSCCLRLHSKS